MMATIMFFRAREESTYTALFKADAGKMLTQQDHLKMALPSQNPSYQDLWT
jgi:hypothetical protein